jgi:cytochrome c6
MDRHEDTMMNKLASVPSRQPSVARAVGFALGAVLIGFAGLAQAADSLKGAKIYNERCADCHGSGGVPTMPGVPDFSRNQRLMQNDLVLVKSISIGKGMMPAFQGLLTEQEIFDVIAYLRTLQ